MEESPRVRFPTQGVPREELLRRMEGLREGDARWAQGRTFSLVYHAGDEHTDFLKRAYGLFFAENGLSPLAFRSLQRFENEVVAMATDLLGGGPAACGTMTSGGSESILMALKAYRDQARARRPHLARPAVLLPSTAHPAFNKAAHYLDLRVIRVPVGADHRVSIEAVRAALQDDVVLLVGSAPSYPQGVVDQIAALGELALEQGLGLHVDACLGGFLLPFLRQLGEPIPAFDLSVPGVTSLSADLHKYGFAAKGASVVLYQDPALRRHQFFAYEDWPGGLFGSTTAAGTRPGGAIAAAWAALTALGQDGYQRSARLIMDTTRRLQEGIRRIPGLVLLGEPAMSVFAFTWTAGNVLVVADALQARGWHVDRQQAPDAIHLMITPAHEPVVEEFLRDLRDSVDYAQAHPEAAAAGNAGMYNMLAQMPERGLVRESILQFMDSLYR